MRSLLLRFWKQRQNLIMSDRHRGSSYFRATGKTLLDSSCTQSTIALRFGICCYFDYMITSLVGKREASRPNTTCLPRNLSRKGMLIRPVRIGHPHRRHRFLKKNPNFGAEISLMDWSVLTQKTSVCVCGDTLVWKRRAVLPRFSCAYYSPLGLNFYKWKKKKS